MKFFLFARKEPLIVTPDDDAWQGNYKHFTEDEMRCKGTNCDCGGTALPRHSFMLKIDMIRGACGFPMIVSSGARCKSHDMFVRGNGTTGSHALLLASDFLAYGYQALQIIIASHYYGITGIGLSQKGDFNKRFIHLDAMESESIRLWSY